MGHKKVIRIDPLTQAFPKGGVDSHAHLDDAAFDVDRKEVLDRARKVGLSQVINIFLNPLEFEQQKSLFRDESDVFYVLGVHPCDGLKATEATFAAMEEAFLREKRLLAVGEIGLDYHWPDCPREIQLEILARQLELAKKLNKPIVIHCREAVDDCLMTLESHKLAGYPLLWHCFGGDVELVKRLIYNNWYISVPGPITYPANTKLAEAVQKIPAERLLFETDCPYLAPNPWRGMRNEPSFTVFTVQALAKARLEDPLELWQRCGDNARRFFGIDKLLAS
ncbi:MAG: TatD family hydrolase [Desulfovibrionaceae bacterium]|nr:TatD family hydrolase [Desulfovibrionaceae bacterium]